MSAAVRHAVSATTHGIGGKLRQICLPALALASALQIGELVAIQFGQSMLAYGLGFAVVVACAGAIVLGRIFKLAAGEESVPGTGALRTALDACKSSVMVADQSHKIVYMNKTMMETLQAAEAEFRKDIPAFDTHALVGAKLDALHKNPLDARCMADDLKTEFETDLKVGGRRFRLLATPVLDDSGKRVGTVLEWVDKAGADEASSSTARIRTALDVCKTNVMVADEDYNIVYMNKTMTEMMSDAEADLRKGIPAFDAAALIGKNIDAFHKNPAHQRQLLSSLTTTFETDLDVGGRNFHLLVTPILGDHGNRLGTVVEWKDETEHNKLEAAAARIRSALELVQHQRDGG